jgi:S-adenosylmethionine decarboxylase proenzyme
MEETAAPGLDARPLGRHMLCDLSGCERLPENPEILLPEMERAARMMGATVVESVFHRFDPWGLSGVVILAESHLAVHTWPEHASACVDLFTCNVEMDPTPGFEHLRRVFAAERWDVTEIRRGRARIGSPLEETC